MKVTLTVRHGGDVQDSLREHTLNQVEGLSKYFERLVEAVIVFDLEQHRHIVEIRLHASGDTLFAHTEAGDWRAAVDGTVDKLRRQLKRHKRKRIQRSLSRAEREELFATVGEASEPSDPMAPPSDWDRISSDEAISRLRTSDEEVLVFVDARDGLVKIARRDDEGVSVVEAEAFEVEDH